MKQLMMTLLACIFMTSGVEACVTYSPSTGTYTVDKSGCVDHGGKTKAKTQKSKGKAPKKK